MSKFPDIRWFRWAVIVLFTKTAYRIGTVPRNGRFVQLRRDEYGGSFRVGRVGIARIGLRMTRFGRAIGTLHTFNHGLGRGITNTQWSLGVRKLYREPLSHAGARGTRLRDHEMFSWMPHVHVRDDGDSGGFEVTWAGIVLTWSHGWGIYGPTPSRRQVWMWNHVWGYVQAPFHAWQERQFNREMDAMRDEADARKAAMQRIEAEPDYERMWAEAEAADDAHRRSRA